MEFPNLGQNCSEPTCRQLDFLPVKCDACGKVFCNDHFRYEKHNCPESYRKDNQVPVCPLCNTPIAIRKGQAPDLVVSQHIDNDCKQKKRLIPVVCEKCRKNYCLRHRLEEDHSCQGFQGTGKGLSNSGAAASARFDQTSVSNGPFRTGGKPQQTALSSVGMNLDRERREREASRSHGSQHSQGNAIEALQAGLSEDEALARAMALSMSESQPSNSQLSQSELAKRQQEEQDAALARALQQEEQNHRTINRQNTTSRQTSRSSEKFCCVS
ncbi:hypothetical protein LSH36_630g01060 [Paralvinella palmiformis]|uniref:AN1-type domain-containing protein n=1 Tax=Paralvinella palmiformis TaxID=53620 RepID=A0AAD9J4A7_9ANNE|nr:hypothetical protein LSH36_630g01060 [Paralvinella palmiformis]